MGMLVVVGGPGGSGSSTIARTLATRFGLHYVYGGEFMRDYARQYGYGDDVSKFLNSDVALDILDELDDVIDKKLVVASRWRDVLIDSKSFAALATFMQIPCSVKIWLDASIEVRVKRTLHKQGALDLHSKLPKHTHMYRKVEEQLLKRYEIDKARFKEQYGIDYDKQEKYNDIIIDTSVYDAGQTLNLILERWENG